MEKLVKIGLAFMALLVFAIFYVGVVGANFDCYREEPATQVSIEQLSVLHSQQFPDATPWETCEQEE